MTPLYIPIEQVKAIFPGASGLNLIDESVNEGVKFLLIPRLGTLKFEVQPNLSATFKYRATGEPALTVK